MTRGSFQTNREMFDHPIWTDITKFRIFFFIYGNAVYVKDGIEIAGQHLNRGQFLRSYRKLQEDLVFVENRSVKKYSLSVIKTKITQLVEENRLKIEVVELGTLFTVVNYEWYQGFERYERENLERRKNAVRTQLERSENNNKKDKKDNKDNSSSSTHNINNAYAELLTTFEQEFGRLLSPIESETISAWVNDDGYDRDLITIALSEAVLNHAYSLKYIERILLTWERRGIRSKSAALTYLNRRKSERSAFQAQRDITPEELPNVPLYNWVYPGGDNELER